MSDTELATAAAALRRAGRVSVFTGAGVSAESDIATFREADGLWARFPPERFATASGLLQAAIWQPRELAAFLRAVLGPLAEARPNDAHFAIAELERHVPAAVVTQNIDGLHQDAGSTAVREIHGSLLEVVRWGGQRVRRLSRAELSRMCRALAAAEQSWAAARTIAAMRPMLGLSWRGVHRPNVVLFGEALREPAWDEAQRDAKRCHVMLVVGTSATVMPAAELPALARSRGATIIVVDPEEAELPAHVHLRGPAAELLPQLVTAAFG